MYLDIASWTEREPLGATGGEPTYHELLSSDLRMNGLILFFNLLGMGNDILVGAGQTLHVSFTITQSFPLSVWNILIFSRLISGNPKLGVFIEHS